MSRTIMAGEEESGKHIHMERGDRLVISLPGYASSGYLWSMDTDCEGSIELSEVKSILPDVPEDFCGDGGARIFTLVARERGDSVVRLMLARPWEIGVEPLKIFSLFIDIA